MPFLDPPRTDSSALRARRRQRLRTLLWRWRALATCLALGAAVAAAVAALRAPEPPTRPAVALTRDTAPGERLGPSLTLARVPARLGPACTVATVAEIADESLAFALPAGTLLCPAMLSSAPVRDLAPAGAVVVPVTLSDPAVAAALHPGDRVNLIRGRSSALGDATGGGDGDGAETRTRIVARNAVVLPARTPAEAPLASGLLGTGAGPASHDSTVLVAVRPEDGVALVDASVSGYIGAVIVQ